LVVGAARLTHVRARRYILQNSNKFEFKFRPAPTGHAGQAVTRIDDDVVRLRVRALVRACALAAICAYGAEAHADGNAAAGKGRFGLCESCHGVQAQGNEGLGAPAIAGLTASYVTRQLENFRAGRRGDATDDVRGQQMRSMAQTLESPEAIADVVAYLETLAPTEPAPTIQGDAAHGKTLFSSCIACHGDRAQGSEGLRAPPLRYSNDWYLVRQLEDFAAGRRGADPADNFGGQMRAMTFSLTDDASRRDVIAYIATLKAP